MYPLVACIKKSTEFASGGELFDRLVTKGAHSEHDAASLLREVMHAVAYLHGHSIVHFDIKPENILVSFGKSVGPTRIIYFWLNLTRYMFMYTAVKDS